MSELEYYKKMAENGAWGIRNYAFKYATGVLGMEDEEADDFAETAVCDQLGVGMGTIADMYDNCFDPYNKYKYLFREHKIIR